MAEKSTKDRLEEVRLLKEELELEALQESVAKSRETKIRQLAIQAQNAAQFKSDREQEAAKQSRCNHRKGGWGIEGLQNGNANDYAVNKMTYADGRTIVMCTRCQKEWKPGDADYNDAMRYPTDNIPAASVTFNIPQAV